MRIEHKKSVVIAGVMAAGLMTMACVLPHDEPCPAYNTGSCPDHSPHVPTCTTDIQQHLNQEVGSGSGKDTQPTVNTCIYVCTWTGTGGVHINCGSVTNNYPGTIPGPNNCPSGSGSGSGSGH